jgi:hypothetical protein
MTKNISIRFKFFSGIDKELKLPDYNPGEGIIMSFPTGKRLKFALKTAGIKKATPYTYFRDGHRITTWARLRDGDEITCLKPSGGG